MRIIIVTSSENRSGGTRQALYQAQGLLERGHDVTLCLPARSSFWDLPVTEHGSFWHALPEKRKEWRVAIEALFAQSTEPVVVHAFHNKAVKLIAWWGLFWRRRGIICVAHRGVIYRPGNPFPYLSPGMQAFLTNSKACSKALRWHCPPKKRLVIPNAVPDERVRVTRELDEVRAELHLTGQETVFGYVGNTAPIKGMQRLILAFAKLCNKPNTEHLRLVLLGGPKNHWDSLLHALNIADRVSCVGFVEHVADYLQACTLFVFPSSGMDSAPNTVLEAMRMGLPIVGTRVGGMPDIVKHNGILVDHKNSDELMKAMEYAVTNPEMYSTWAEGSKHLSKQYSLDSRCKALEEIYCRLLKKRGHAI